MTALLDHVCTDNCHIRIGLPCNTCQPSKRKCGVLKDMERCHEFCIGRGVVSRLVAKILEKLGRGDHQLVCHGDTWP